MTDLDQRIVRALHECAEGPVDTDRLTARAVAGGRARRRRRRRAGAGAALGLVAVLGFTATTGTGLPEDARWPGAAATVAATAAPPRADGVTGAATRPDLIGTDPETLHFGIDPARARYLSWEVAPGLEGVRVDVGGGRAVTVELARSSSALRQRGIEGLPVEAADLATEAAFDGTVSRQPAVQGTTPTWVRHWRPAPGLYARSAVTADTAEELDVAAGALRLDEARGCVAPVRLTTLPPGARLTGCAVNATTFPAALFAVLRVDRAGEQRMSVSFQYARSFAGSRTEGNRTIGGRAAYLYGDQLELLGFPKAHLTASFGWPYQGFTEADAATVLGGAQVAEDLTRAETWD